jgi:hypothetical protein
MVEGGLFGAVIIIVAVEIDDLEPGTIVLSIRFRMKKQ